MWTEEEVKSYADRCAELSHPDDAAIGINATKLARLVHVDAILSERQKAKPVVEALEKCPNPHGGDISVFAVMQMAMGALISEGHKTLANELRLIHQNQQQALKDYTSLK